jgi:hypothetical protein
MNIGLIQSSGLGDIVIALPIARAYYEQGHHVHWPIYENHLKSFQEAAPWINWYGIVEDGTVGPMYRVPLQLLRTKVDQIICLYHHLREPEYAADPALASVLKFDQYKYAVAKVPFSEKWNLARCLVRNREREKLLFDSVVRQEKYAVAHLDGHDESRDFDFAPAIQRGYQIIRISKATESLFDWLTILEGAGTLVMIDSVFSNLVDQLSIGSRVPKIFLRRSHNRVSMTPVMLGHWLYR